MALFPDFDEYSNYLTEGQYRTYYATHCLLCLLYIAVVVLHLVNCYQIVYRQGRWRTLPILVFYVLAWFSIMSRFFLNVFAAYQFDRTQHLWVFRISIWQPFAKISVGLVQAWMMFELAIRIKYFTEPIMPTESGIRKARRMG